MENLSIDNFGFNKTYWENETKDMFIEEHIDRDDIPGSSKDDKELWLEEAWAKITEHAGNDHHS